MSSHSDGAAGRTGQVGHPCILAIILWPDEFIRRSFAKQPAQQSEREADEDASDDGKIERRPSFLDKDVSGEFSKPAEPARLPNDRADADQHEAENENDFSKILHDTQG